MAVEGRRCYWHPRLMLVSPFCLCGGRVEWRGACCDAPCSDWPPPFSRIVSASLALFLLPSRIVGWGSVVLCCVVWCCCGGVAVLCAESGGWCVL